MLATSPPNKKSNGKINSVTIEIAAENKEPIKLIKEKEKSTLIKKTLTLGGISPVFLDLLLDFEFFI